MKISPSLSYLLDQKYSDEYKVVPVYKDIVSDFTTPIEVIRKLKSISKHCFILESTECSEKWGRYTFIGFDPILEISCINSRLSITGIRELEILTKNPGKYIYDILSEYKSINLEQLPMFSGGLVGYFSYDYLKYSEETLNLDAKDEEHFKDVDLMLFDKVIVFDHYAQKIKIIVNIKRTELEVNYSKAIEDIQNIIDILKNKNLSKRYPGKCTSDFRDLFSKREYMKKVEIIKNHIKEGNIFQLVLSNRMEADFQGSLFDTYRILRTTNPSAYMFYFSSDDIEMAGASPETLVKLENHEMHTFPLAGTRPRGINKKEDCLLEKELLSDEKELAEHNMLVDLGRNDIGKISEFGSVKVEEYMQVHKFSHVMHLGSSIYGKLKEDMNVMDVIEAILPAGTLSGAPKLKACKIINQLENNKRGVYGGAIGYLDLRGNLDTCIAIRLVFKKNGKVFVRSGAGIVADSNPEKEYKECSNKAKAVLEALKLAEGGIDE